MNIVSSPLILIQPLIKMPLTSNNGSAEHQDHSISNGTSVGQFTLQGMAQKYRTVTLMNKVFAALQRLLVR